MHWALPALPVQLEGPSVKVRMESPLQVGDGGKSQSAEPLVYWQVGAPATSAQLVGPSMKPVTASAPLHVPAGGKSHSTRVFW